MHFTSWCRFCVVLHFVPCAIRSFTFLSCVFFSRPILSVSEGSLARFYTRCAVRPLLYVVRLIICPSPASAAVRSFSIDHSFIEQRCQPDDRDGMPRPRALNHRVAVRFHNRFSPLGTFYAKPDNSVCYVIPGVSRFASKRIEMSSNVLRQLIAGVRKMRNFVQRVDISRKRYNIWTYITLIESRCNRQNRIITHKWVSLIVIIRAM